MTDNMNIQWYPGHMTKTRRQIEADLKQVAKLWMPGFRFPAAIRTLMPSAAISLG